MAQADAFTKVVLDNHPDGRAYFRDEVVELVEQRPGLFLSDLVQSGGAQLRSSPPGYRTDFHCTVDPQWVFVLSGALEIGLQDGTARVFRAGQHLFSQDVVPAGATFDPAVHGHCSRQVGDDPVVTLFVRA